MEEVPAAQVGKGLALLASRMLSLGRQTPLGCFARHSLYSASLREMLLETKACDHSSRDGAQLSVASDSVTSPPRDSVCSL